jgi:trans-aconitate 2-methyltransferase
MTTGWDPQQYLRFEGERERPFFELLARVDHPEPRIVVDLGCGPGTTTAHLVERWPSATVLGIDSSPAMIDAAAARAIPGRLSFRQGDLREWEPDAPVDVLLCCATLQWVPDHAQLLPRFLAALAPGGRFAFQVPGNFRQPSHTLLYELATSERWSALLGDLVRPEPVLEPAGYLERLLAAGAEADVWETTYLHVLTGPDAVLEWVRGTALRPYLSTLGARGSPGDLEEFTSAYSALLRAAYPRDAAWRTLFPFRRIFGVASVSIDPGRGSQGSNEGVS